MKHPSIEPRLERIEIRKLSKLHGDRVRFLQKCLEIFESFSKLLKNVAQKCKEIPNFGSYVKFRDFCRFIANFEGFSSPFMQFGVKFWPSLAARCHFLSVSVDLSRLFLIDVDYSRFIFIYCKFLLVLIDRH